MTSKFELLERLAAAEQALSELKGEVLEKVGPTLKLRAGIVSDVLSAHQNRGNGASQWMREDDAEFRRDLAEDFRALSTLYDKLSSIEVRPELPSGDVKNAAGAGEGSEADSARLDWLEMQCVEVRTPLVHGSRANFHANPYDSYEGEEHPSDLRAKVDAAMAPNPSARGEL